MTRSLTFEKVASRGEHRTLFYRLDDKPIEHLLDERIEHVEDILQ